MARWIGVLATAVGLSVAAAVPVGGVSTSVPAQGGGTSADVEAFLDAAYRGLLGRTPDPAGRQYWQERFADGTVPRVVLESFGVSAEHQRHVVTRAYQRFLDRDPEPAGHAWWSDRLVASRAATDLWAGLAGSSEYFHRRGDGTTDGFVRALYDDVLGRSPDSAGLAHWSEQIDRGASRSSVARAVMASPEAFGLSDLPVRSATPGPGATVERLDEVALEVGVDLMADMSSVIVMVDGRRVSGDIEVDGRMLRFGVTQTPTWTPFGEPVRVIVTAFGYDGSDLARADYSFTLRRGPSPGRTDGELPRGGTELFPRHLLVAFYGGHSTPDLGVLGHGTPDQAGQRLLGQIEPYLALTDREVMPVFELIATIALSAPGPAGNYSAPTDPADIEPYLDAVRDIDGLLVLDIQPGRASFIGETRRYEQFLKQPDVGLALDPEWKVGPTGRPGGGFIGSIDAAEINEVSAYLADLVAEHDLPEKLLIIHRFTPGMVTNDHEVIDRDGVAIVFHADGIGSPEAKLADYHSILPDRFARGIKVFYDQDTRVMAPDELAGLDPTPGFISYQ